MSPRLLRFLLVYVLVGLTFTALSAGSTERLRGAAGGEKGGLGATIIGSSGEQR